MLERVEVDLVESSDDVEIRKVSQSLRRVGALFAALCPVLSSFLRAWRCVICTRSCLALSPASSRPCRASASHVLVRCVSPAVGFAVVCPQCITSGFFFNTAKLDKTGNYKTVKHNQTVHIHPASCLFQGPSLAHAAVALAPALSLLHLMRLSAPDALLPCASRLPACCLDARRLCFRINLSCSSIH